MSSTRFEVIVFDFDGTLVQSAAAKRQAFFEIFPGDCAEAVTSVLERDPDGSRHRVIPEMIAEAARRGLMVTGLDASTLAGEYGRKVLADVANAAELPGAGDLLRRAAAHAALYVASATPHDDLLSLLENRGWLQHLSGAFGHPHRKDEIVHLLLQRHGIGPSRLLVVGDGESDRTAAAHNGCPFHLIEGPQSLMEIPGLVEMRHV